MRLLVISLPRTGSTSFSKDLAKKNDLTFVFEPFAPMAKQFNKSKNFDSDYSKENVVVKTLINDEYGIEWLINLCKSFDQVFLLSRLSLKECIESWAFLNHKRNETIGFDFETEYYWEKTPNYEEAESQIYRWDNKLNELSKKINTPILYYENIFGVNNNTLRKGDKKFNRKLI